MEPGALKLYAPWNPLLRSTVRWQATLPRRGFRPPRGSKVLLASVMFGHMPRMAHRCPTCATVVVPPDDAYDGAGR